MELVGLKGLVSVIMPVYNSSDYLKESIESIINQSYENWELILIDDGSTDDSVNILASFCKLDKRIRLFQNDSNRKLIYTRNKGLDLARGEFIAFLDSDDISVSDRLKIQVEFLKSHPEIGACGGYALKFDASRNLPEQAWKYPLSYENIKIRLLWGSALVMSTLVVRNAVVKEYDLKFKDGLHSVEDYQFLIDISRRSPIQNLPRIMAHYRIHNNQLTSAYSYQRLLSNKISLNQFQSFGIKISNSDEDEVRKSLIKLLNLSLRFSNSNFKIIIAVFDSIWYWNKVYKHFQPELLSREFSDKIYMVIKYADESLDLSILKNANWFIKDGFKLLIFNIFNFIGIKFKMPNN